MLELLNVPPNMVAFRASGPVTREDYHSVLIPGVKRLLHFQKDVNFLLVLDESVFIGTYNLWIDDVLKSLTRLRNWNRAAIVSDLARVEALARAYAIFARGRFRNFQIRDLGRAIFWTSGVDLVL